MSGPKLSLMKQKTVLAGAVLIGILVIFAGCSGPQTSAVTPAPTPSSPAPAVIVSAGADLVPSPTDSVLDANRVNINVEKDYLGNVIVTFQGGSGLQQVNKIDVTLNRDDGQVKTGDVGTRVDDSLTLEGTKNTDRIIVYVSMKDGKRYKVIDTLVAYRARL